MEETGFKVYGYRWVVLLAFMGVVAINQLLWITFAAITGNAAAYYGVSDLSIGVLSLSFMMVYIMVSIPASWMIDTYGMRVAVGLGVVLTGAFGLLRGFAGPNIPGAAGADRDRRRAAIHPQCGDHRGGALVPAARAGHRRRPGLAGDLPGHHRGLGAHSVPDAAVGDQRHAADLRGRGRDRHRGPSSLWPANARLRRPAPPGTKNARWCSTASSRSCGSGISCCCWRSSSWAWGCSTR